MAANHGRSSWNLSSGRCTRALGQDARDAVIQSGFAQSRQSWKRDSVSVEQPFVARRCLGQQTGRSLRQLHRPAVWEMLRRGWMDDEEVIQGRWDVAPGRKAPSVGMEKGREASEAMQELAQETLALAWMEQVGGRRVWALETIGF